MLLIHWSWLQSHKGLLLVKCAEAEDPDDASSLFSAAVLRSTFPASASCGGSDKLQKWQQS